jgi:hypothetical protein
MLLVFCVVVLLEPSNIYPPWSSDLVEWAFPVEELDSVCFTSLLHFPWLCDLV